MDLLNIVVQPTWREFLVDLVQTNQMDPWDVDVGKVADAYLAKVHELQSMDLRIPANVILASALLLHFKAKSLSFENLFEPAVEEEVVPLLSEDVPDLFFRGSLPRRRKITLDELLTAVDKVMKQGKRRQMPTIIPEALNIELPKENLHEKIIRVYEKAHSLKDAENVLLFSALLEDKSADQITLTLIPVLHLVQEQRMLAWQDTLFGEIFLRILEKEDGAVGASAEDGSPQQGEKTVEIQVSQVAAKMA